VTTWEALAASLEAMLVPIVGCLVVGILAWLVVELVDASDESELWPQWLAPDLPCSPDCGVCHEDQALALANDELTVADLPESFRPGGVA